MNYRVRLIGRSRLFTEDLSRLLEDCGFQTLVHRLDSGPPAQRGHRAIDIFEVKRKSDLSHLQPKNSARPFLIYTSLKLPDDLLAALKTGGLRGIITKETPLESILYLINRILFRKKMPRRNPRIPAKIPVILKARSTVREAFAVNLSRDGLFILTLNPWPVDTECELEFQVPEKRKKLRTKGIVLYTVPINTDLNIIAHPQKPFKRIISHPGMGIFFTNLPPEDKERIDQYILRHTI